MGRIAKSQWDFGELFPPDQIQKALTVGELTSQLKRLLEKQFNEVRVAGEVSNLKVQGSGHIYFVLKDASAQLNCVLFRGETQVDRSLLEDGRDLVLKGQITVYEPRGSYQLRVTGLELKGVGALQAAFEKLKAKLKAEGLFAPDRKRPLPAYPTRVGLVTSPTGAAIRDVLHVVERRYAGLEIVLAPCRVQGQEAAAEIVRSIALLNQLHAFETERGGKGLNLILVTRGGGSLEDLWPFNEEIVARAIFNSVLPVVSAVGHEVDFTISDFVADVRAATPSAAAEILTEDMVAGCRLLGERLDRLRQLTKQQFQRANSSFDRALNDLRRLHPRRALESRSQNLDVLFEDLRKCVGAGFRLHRQNLAELSNRLTRLRPRAAFVVRNDSLALLVKRLRELAAKGFQQRQQRLDHAFSALRLLGPEQVLGRGYSITMDQHGKIVRDASRLAKGDWLTTALSKGRVGSRVEKIDTDV